MKKYEIDTSRKICLGNSRHLYFVYRIRALKDFADVRAGDYGGYVTLNQKTTLAKKARVGFR